MEEGGYSGYGWNPRKRSYRGKRYGASKKLKFPAKKVGGRRTGGRGLSLYREPKLVDMATRPFYTKIKISRNCRSTGAGGVAPVGAIALWEAAYASNIPMNGAMTFSFSELGPISSYAAIYQQARLNGVLIEYFPAATTQTIRGQAVSNQAVAGSADTTVTYNSNDRAIFVYDPDTSDLENAGNLQEHRMCKVFMNNTNKPARMFIKPKILETIQSEDAGGSVVDVQCASKSPPWISIGAGTASNSLTVRHYGFKWAVAPEIASDLDPLTYNGGIMQFTYFLGFRFSY